MLLLPDPITQRQGLLRRKVQGTVKWVGTTEAAALLRQFGVRARIVDFKGACLFASNQCFQVLRPALPNQTLCRHIVPLERQCADYTPCGLNIADGL